VPATSSAASKRRQPAIRRAFVLHNQPLMVDLIRLTLNHGLFTVVNADSLASAEPLLVRSRPHMALVDMDHEDSEALLSLLGTSNTLRGSVVPVQASVG